MLGTLRILIPEPIRKKLRGRHNSIKTRFWDNPRELLTLKLYQLKGKSYLQWYAERLDRFAESDSAVSSGMADTHRYYLSGDEDLELLIDLGLKPEHKLFEMGCGFGRSAQHFVRYLGEKNYVGSEISRGRLRQCEELLRHRGLMDKQPELLVNPDNSFDWLGQRTFDFLWAGNVFTHVPPEDMETIMANAHKVMHADSRFVFTYTRNPDETMHRHHAKDWDRNYEYFEALAGRHGFVSENVSHLSRQRDGHSPNERMVMYTLRARH